MTYDVTDTNLNPATQVTRIVNVVAGDSPILTLSGSGGVVVEVNSSYLDA